jgi:acetyl-CoA carboxylase carboxyltransferase component
VLAELVDDGELLEVQPSFGSALVTALAHLGGRSVAIVANDPGTLERAPITGPATMRVLVGVALPTGWRTRLA